MNALWLKHSTAGDLKHGYNRFVESRPCSTYEACAPPTSPALWPSAGMKAESWVLQAWLLLLCPHCDRYWTLAEETASSRNEKNDMTSSWLGRVRLGVLHISWLCRALSRQRWTCSPSSRADSNDASHYWGQIRTGSQGLTKAVLPPPVCVGPIYRLQLHQQPLEEIQLTHCRPTEIQPESPLSFRAVGREAQWGSLFIQYFSSCLSRKMKYDIHDNILISACKDTADPMKFGVLLRSDWVITLCSPHGVI